MPTWLHILLAAATPIAAALASYFGVWLGRKSAKELDRWRRREETMRMLRWAADHAVSDNDSSEVGVVTLEALRGSELLQDEDQDLINAVLTTVASEAMYPEAAGYTGYESSGCHEEVET